MELYFRRSLGCRYYVHVDIRELSPISKSKCSAKILFGDIKNIIIKMLPNCYRSKVDRFSHCYLHVNFQYRENVVILKYIFFNIIHIYIIILKLY